MGIYCPSCDSDDLEELSHTSGGGGWFTPYVSVSRHKCNDCGTRFKFTSNSDTGNSYGF